MLEKLKGDGRRLVTIIDPHSKVDQDYWIYNESLLKNLNVKQLTGNGDYESECWPK